MGQSNGPNGRLALISTTPPSARRSQHAHIAVVGQDRGPAFHVARGREHPRIGAAHDALDPPCSSAGCRRQVATRRNPGRPLDPGRDPGAGRAAGPARSVKPRRTEVIPSPGWPGRTAAAASPPRTRPCGQRGAPQIGDHDTQPRQAIRLPGRTSIDRVGRRSGAPAGSRGRYPRSCPGAAACPRSRAASGRRLAGPSPRRCGAARARWGQSEAAPGPPGHRAVARSPCRSRCRAASAEPSQDPSRPGRAKAPRGRSPPPSCQPSRASHPSSPAAPPTSRRTSDWPRRYGASDTATDAGSASG